MNRSEYHKEYRRRRIEEGLCLGCGSQAKAGKKRCLTCLRKRSKSTAQRRKKGKEKGLCSGCGVHRPVEAKKTCKACLVKVKLQNEERKKRAVEEYGGQCEFCGERDLRYLTIDHVNNDGAKHRLSSGCGSGSRMYTWLRSHGYPSGFQVLCWNCNSAKQYSDYDPRPELVLAATGII